MLRPDPYTAYDLVLTIEMVIPEAEFCEQSTSLVTVQFVPIFLFTFQTFQKEGFQQIRDAELCIRHSE